jgi:hypothetical protein
VLVDRPTDRYHLAGNPPWQKNCCLFSVS